jgi:fructose 1,6-bisphosphatase
VLTLSININSGRIGAISDQFALGTPWDWVRTRAAELAVQFRNAHGIKQPATLHEDELEYQEGWKERRTRLEGRFELRPPLVWNDNGKKGAGRSAGKVPARA